MSSNYSNSGYDGKAEEERLRERNAEQLRLQGKTIDSETKEAPYTALGSLESIRERIKMRRLIEQYGDYS